MGEREVSGDERNLAQVTNGITRSSADPDVPQAEPATNPPHSAQGERWLRLAEVWDTGRLHR